MAPDSNNAVPDNPDDLIHGYLALRDQVERQRQLIELLSKPQHWTQSGPRGAQATALHNALDGVLERAVKVRDIARRGQSPSTNTRSSGSTDDEADGYYLRLRQAADLLGATGAGDGPALDAFVATPGLTTLPAGRVAWLGLVAALGRYPGQFEVARAVRALRIGGAFRLRELLEQLHLEAVSDGDVNPHGLSVRSGAVVVDVTHTSRYDLHTGIQRVVRELASNWLQDPRTVLVWWDDDRQVLRELGHLETYRFRDWSRHLPTDVDSEPLIRDFDDTPGAPVVPWNSTFVLPELCADPERSDAYCGLVTSGVLEGFGAIGFDLVPVLAAETVHHGMVSVFNTHLSVIKHADRISAISESAAAEFRALWTALEAQGIPAPHVVAQPLPPTPHDSSVTDLAAIREIVGETELPIVLVVGSREPRKNQIAVLGAALRLWLAGHRFHLVMVGGSGWNSADIDDEIDRLRAVGLSIVTRTRATESELFAWYRSARFSVFPSLYEGFGLPIVESLGVGTPVITSNFGAMAEVARDGGCMLVDPRDADQLHDAIEQLLTDDAALATLTAEAQARTWTTWPAYSTDVWSCLVGLPSDLPR